jgi:hypothetical protein
VSLGAPPKTIEPGHERTNFRESGFTTLKNSAQEEQTPLFFVNEYGTASPSISVVIFL